MKHFGRSCVCFLKWLCKASLNKLNCLELTFKVKLTEKARVEHKENKEGSHLHRFLLSMSPVDCFFFFSPSEAVFCKVPACLHACSVSQSCLTLFDPMSQPDSSVRGIFQARILEWVAISSFKESAWPRNWTHISCVSCIGRRILYHRVTWSLSKCSGSKPSTVGQKEYARTFISVLFSFS